MEAGGDRENDELYLFVPVQQRSAIELVGSSKPVVDVFEQESQFSLVQISEHYFSIQDPARTQNIAHNDAFSASAELPFDSKARTCIDLAFTICSASCTLPLAASASKLMRANNCCCSSLIESTCKSLNDIVASFFFIYISLSFLRPYLFVSLIFEQNPL
ncbi:hypothetical protein AYI70_g35 [Smittium culicis]|uniref:Uncharacterized protein n=1 Tax=Smittium culicis TaxID=133412 RepID=A0A1R1YI64_9FUNG|nr:hypothetical protein AYI70_g35 [Smittium culicis]